MVPQPPDNGPLIGLPDVGDDPAGAVGDTVAESFSGGPTTVVFLHGVGQTPQAWQDQVVALPGQVQAIAPWLRGMRPGRPDGFELGAAAASVVGDLDRSGVATGRLCGLSLGGTVALQTAVDYPDRVERLVVCAAAVNPPRWVTRAQRLAMRAVPEKRFRAQGIMKDQALAAMTAMMAVDLSGRLSEIAAPTLVLVGEHDKANKPAAKLIVGQVPGAEYAEVPGAGHTANADAPQAFNELALPFLTG